MSFNASDYIKPPSPEYATDRELQGDQTDLKINDLRRDTITCINALASGAPTGTVTVDSISTVPTGISDVKNLTPPVIQGTVGHRILSTPLGTMVLVNCSFDGTTFTADDTGVSASMSLISVGSTTEAWQTTTTTPWTVWEYTKTSTAGGSVINKTTTGSALVLNGGFSAPSSPNGNETVFAYLPINALLGFTPTFSVVATNEVNITGPYTATLANNCVRVAFKTVAANLPSSVELNVAVIKP